MCRVASLEEGVRMGSLLGPRILFRAWPNLTLVHQIPSSLNCWMEESVERIGDISFLDCLLLGGLASWQDFRGEEIHLSHAVTA